MQKELVRITDLAQLYCVSTVTMGKWLKELGLRDETGYPMGWGLVISSRRPLKKTGETQRYFWLWEKAEVVALLAKNGRHIPARAASNEGGVG